MNFTITPGKVRFNAFDEGQRVIEHDDCYVWSFDLDSKYAEVKSYLYNANSIGVWIGAGERTLGLADDPDLPDWTYVEFDVGEDLLDWGCLAEVSRYTLTVVIWKDDR